MHCEGRQVHRVVQIMTVTVTVQVHEYSKNGALHTPALRLTLCPAVFIEFSQQHML